MLGNVSSLSLSSRYITTLPIKERISSSDALRSLRPNSIHSPKARVSGFSIGHLIAARDVVGTRRPDSFSFHGPAAIAFIFLPTPSSWVCVLPAFSFHVCQNGEEQIGADEHDDAERD